MRHLIEEIGSEFWIDEIAYSVDGGYYDFKENGFNGDNRLLLSGRTAIDYICQDIACLRKINTVYMPAYCCDSMIFPFRNRDIDVIFYDINHENGNIKCDIDVTLNIDILYICNYFGFSTGVDIETIVNAQAKGVIVLYDKTHVFLGSEDKCESIADYSFCSLRKWMGIPTGAIASKKNGNFFNTLLKECDFAGNKYKGMKMKYFYLQGNTAIKEDFFRLFASFNKNLVDDYQDYSIDQVSLRLLYAQDFEQMKVRRQRNAELLYAELPESENLSMMFQRVGACIPLFVPILVKKEIRNLLRDYLIENKVYCPVHWAKSPSLPDSMRVNAFYDSELSLICDQRYGEREMRRITDLIMKFCNRINV